MLKINVPTKEWYSQKENLFYTVKGQILTLEHSLVSISKWESKWQRPFLSKLPMTKDQELDYIRCMTLTQNVDPRLYQNLSAENYTEIREYIESPMTATTISNPSKKKTNEVITSELIYYWMSAAGIPFSCEKWHLNRLLTLLEIAGIKSAPSKKMSKRDILSKNTALNQARKKALHTRG